jgi:hypothetical protein
MGALYFDLWPANGLKGTATGELTSAFGKTMRVEHDALGSGKFSINRHDAQAAWVVTGALIRVRLVAGGPFAYNDARYVFAFFIDEGEDVTVSPDEEGGEDYLRGGRGILTYVQRAIMYHVNTLGPDQPVDGEWRWTNSKYGAILNRIYDEAAARTPSPIADATQDFTATLDSAGVAWPSFTGDFALPVGLDHLSAIAKLQDVGLQVRMTPALVLQAYNDYSRDMTASITFNKGVNIREAATRAIHASPVKSRMLVQGKTKAGVMIFTEVIDAAIEADPKIGRREGFVQYEATATTSELTKAGQQALKRLKNRADGPQTIGVTYGADDGSEVGAGHYRPFTDYREGDKVIVNIPGEYSSSPAQIKAIQLDETEGGEADPTIEFTDIPFDPLATLDTLTGTLTGKKGAQPCIVTCEDLAQVTGRAPVTAGASCSGTPEPHFARRRDGEDSVSGIAAATSEFGSWVWFNSAYTTVGCLPGGGGWSGYNDEDLGFKFTAPADAVTNLGLLVTINASAISKTTYTGGWEIRLLQGAMTKFGQGSPIAGGPESGSTTIYLPRSLVSWGGENWLIFHPRWLCARDAFFCNAAAYFGNPHDDGRGQSGAYSNLGISTVCVAQFASGVTGMAPGVAGYGAVDGLNRLFTLIGWTGAGPVNYSINGLEQPTGGLVLDGTAKTATLDAPPPSGSVTLFTYPVSA